MPELTRSSADDVSYLAGLVRSVDRPRYYATLFAPAAMRADLFALYGFAAEIERIPDQVTDPTLGQIRLQWWRDSLRSGEEGAGDGQNPALRALTAVIARHSLPLAPLLSLIDARSADLYSDPPPTLADLEELLGKTQSSLFALAAQISRIPPGDSAAAARDAGLAYGLARRLSAFAADRARGRTILTHDLLAMEGLDGADVFASQRSDGLHKVVTALADLARHHLRVAEAETARLPRRVLPAFLPLAVVKPLLDRMQQLDAEILERPASLSDLETILRIGMARFFRGTDRTG